MGIKISERQVREHKQMAQIMFSSKIAQNVNPKQMSYSNSSLNVTIPGLHYNESSLKQLHITTQLHRAMQGL